MFYQTLSYQRLVPFCRDVYKSYGFTEEESATITDVLLRADLYGIESHGIQRMVRYHKEILGGLVDLGGKPETVFETPISAVIEANKAMGQVISRSAMELAIAKAKASGVGMVAVRNSNHYGIAGYYAEMAVDADLMGICMTNTEAIGVPTYGKRAMLGTNPIALSFPADPVPFLFDAATTVVPRGKLEVYNKNGKPLPEGWAVDTAGRPSSNAEEILTNIIAKAGGGIAPLGGGSELHGGHKGYGLGAIVDLFTGVLSCGKTSNHINVEPGKTEIAHFFLAMDYGLFGEKEAIRKRMSVFLQELRDSPKADGQERIYTHGEKERESRARKLVEGIPVNEKTLQEMKDIAAHHALSFEQYFGQI